MQNLLGNLIVLLLRLVVIVRADSICKQPALQDSFGFFLKGVFTLQLRFRHTLFFRAFVALNLKS